MSKTLKAWSVQLGCNFDWLDQGKGEIYPINENDPFAVQNREKLYQLAQERAREERKSEITMQLTTVPPKTNIQYSNPNPEILYLAISTLFEALETTNKSLSPEAKAKVVVQLYAMYNDKEATNIKNHVLDLIRALGVVSAG